MNKHLEQWQELNDRQQATLIAIYKADQQTEQNQKQAWNYGQEKQPASVWRKLRYPDLYGGETRLHYFLRKAGVIDKGLGSTLDALERRKLCISTYQVRKVRQNELLTIELTKLGRAVARAGLGETAPKKRLKGQLKPRQWEALVTAYNAGNNGIEHEHDDYAGFSWRWTWLTLRDYYGLGKGLVEEVGYWKEGKHYSKLVITQAGKEFYCQHKEEYCALYSNIEV